MERNFESFWTIAGERASKITSGELRFPEPAATITTSSPTSETKAPPVAVGQDVPFLSLATFRMLVLSSPVLETFFERDLASSFILTEPERSETGGVFAWHSAAPGANRLVPGSKEALNSKTFSSDLSSELGVGSGNYAYSKDVTPGARGKALGFLGGLLGEEGKMRMNQIVDNVGQRLQTTTVVGPKPSFGNNKTTLDGNRIDTDEIKMKEEDDARRNGGISGLTRWGLGARLADAVRGQTGTASSTTSNPNSPAPRGRPAQRVTTLQSQAQAQAQAKRNSLRGLDLSSSGPAGAAESLRAAAAAIQERSHFVIDEPSAAEGDVTQDGEGDEVEDGEGEALLTEERAEERGEITGKEAQMAKGELKSKSTARVSTLVNDKTGLTNFNPFLTLPSELRTAPAQR